MGTVIVVTSGKGGTGKTSITGGVAACLSLLGRRVGDRVNLECDIIGKYVEKLLQPLRSRPEEGGGGLTREFLVRNGVL